MTKPTKSTNEFANFMDTFVAELIAMPDEQVLEGRNPAEVRAHGLKLLEGARREAGRQRLAAAKAEVAARKQHPEPGPAEKLDIAQARRFLMEAQNDSRFTLAARKLGDLSDEEVLKLYRQVKSLQGGDGDSGAKK